MQNGVNKTSLQLYRDCLRLVYHIAGNSGKAMNIRSVVRGEFRRNMYEEDPEVVERLRGNAIRGLANYLMMESSVKDDSMQKAATQFNTNIMNNEEDSDENSGTQK